ncbi:MAG TPA: PBP1A family penicillin-binding protein [Gemmatimonadota bacterium]|nr:PBP1A family penicillin-binding protein [Gemmatimonadota bacterium]
MAQPNTRRLIGGALLMLPLLLVLLLVGLAAYVVVLERRVTAKWEGRKWNVPSKVYSDAFLLFSGKRLSARAFEARLERLGYLEQVGGVDEVGEYAGDEGTWLVYLHAFTYPDGHNPAFPIRVETAGGVVQELSHARTGEELASAALEPEVIGVIFDQHMEDRTPVDLEEIPRYVVEAILAVEDARFYYHLGIDPVRMVGAAIANLRAGGTVQGGSTITQQLVKNYYLTADRTYRRKFTEGLMAAILEIKYPKEAILEAYLNEIYFGQRGSSSIMGIEEAARFYFGKSVREIDLSQAALLAGLIRDPGGYNPHRQPERALERRDLVLRLMHDQDRLTDDQHARARNERLLVRGAEPHFNDAPYFVDYVLRELAERYPRSLLESQGLRIFTTLDMELQVAAQQALVEGLEHLEEGYPRLEKRAGELEGAVVVIDPQTGFVRAMIGGRDYQTSQFNRAEQAERQPGSTFKPFVYLTAFLTPGRWNPATTIEDVPFEVVSGGEVWAPDNYDDTYHGSVTLRNALANSMNVATSRLALEVGLNRVTRTAHEAGIEGRLRPLPSLALGAFEVTPLDLASAYATLANGGIRTEPLSILSAVDDEGHVVQRQEVEMERVLPADAVYLVNHMLQDVFDRGTARRARPLGYGGRAAGKTGTTNSTRDAWFVGYTTEIVALVWVGYDDNEPIGLHGDRGALPIWVEFMKRSGYGDRSPEFPAPRNIVLVEVDPETGELAAPGCPVTRYEVFVAGTEPMVECRLHGPVADDGWWIF